MSCDFQSMCSLRSSFPYIFRRYHRNILKTYHYAWDAFEHIDNISKLRSCEQEIIKLDKIKLQHSLHQLCIKTNELLKPYYISKEIACVLFHLINVFCTPGQEEKMRLVQVKLNEVLHTVTEEERCDIIERYISQLLKAKSSLTEIDMLTGQIDSQHELLCKLFYWDRFYSKNGDEGCKEFLKINADFLVSNIEGMATNWGFMWHKKLQLIACNILLCLLNWNICKTQKPVILQKDMEKPVLSSVSLVADPSTNYSFTNRASNMLQKILSTLSEEEIFKAFNEYREQMYAMNSEITEDDFCIGMIEPYNEFLLKLCYCEALCNKNDAFCMDFLRRNADLFILQIELVADGENKKLKPISCTILLCLLNLNMCTLKTTPLMFQNTEIQACPSDVSVADTSANYYYTAETIKIMLQKLISTLSEDNIYTAFNDYLDQMYAINSELTEDDLCTGMLEPYHEFMLKLCYCEKLCIERDEENLKKILRRNTDFLVHNIEKWFNKENKKTKLISCKVLLCLTKWGISYQNTAYTSLENILSQMQTLDTDCEDFINENVPFFLSMVGNVMTRKNIPVLIELCGVLISAPYNESHCHDVTGAINKLIRYYAKQVGINQNILEWIIKLGYRILKHLYYNQNLNTAIKIEIDFQNLFNLLEDLFTDSYQNSKTLNLNFYSSQPNRFYYESLTCFYEDPNRLELFESRVKELWIDIIKCQVKAIQISNKIRNKGREVSIIRNENLIPMKFLYTNIPMSAQNFIAEWKANQKEEQLITDKMEAQLNEIKMADEMVKKLKLYEMLVLYMMLMIVGTSTGHHKSAKLKKYLSLKYEYATASLYLLWCSGDIEVHPGPNDLEHDSSIERRWISNICEQLVNRLSKKFKSTKKRKNDRDKRDYFKTLLKTSLEETVYVTKQYLAEINAWEIKAYKLLDKLFIYRCEIETILTSLQDFLTSSASIKDLSAINVSFETELNKTNELAMVLRKYQRPNANIPRHLAGILIKCAHGKDPNAKCDGIYDLPLKNWPKDKILFDPNNRGKYMKKYSVHTLIPDQELVDILLTLPQVTIPQIYKPIMDAYSTMRKGQKDRKSQKDKSINKKHKAELCSTFKRITSLEKLDYALKNLWESGILTEEVHNNLNKWWTTRAVDTKYDKTFSLVDINDAGKKEQPRIVINISTKSMTLTVEQSDANSSQVSYDFPFKDELVPLKTMDTTVSQTTIQKPSSDSCQMVNAKIHLTVSPKPDACSADNQINLIIIPPDEMIALNSGLPYDLYPIRQKILESDVKHQHDMSSHETAVCSTIHFDKPTSSTNQIRQLNQDIAISGQPGPILCTPNQSTTNSNDISSATKDSQNPDFHMQVSPTSDIGSSDSISSVNSESGNEDGDQINIPNRGHVLLTDSDYSSDSSNICVSKPNMKKRKCMEEDRNEMKKRKVPSLKQDKKPKETNHMYRKDDSSMDKSTIFNTNMELLQDCLQIDLDSFDFDDQTFDVKLNALDNQDKNRQICDKDRNFMNGETQISNKNTNVSVYDTNVSSDLERFLQEMIYIESEKMSQTKTSLTEV